MTPKRRRKTKRVQCGHFRGFFTRIVSDEGTWDYAVCSACFHQIGERFPVSSGQPYRPDWKAGDFRRPQ